MRTRAYEQCMHSCTAHIAHYSTQLDFKYSLYACITYANNDDVHKFYMYDVCTYTYIIIIYVYIYVVCVDYDE